MKPRASPTTWIEHFLARRFQEPLTVLDIARAVGTIIPVLRRSMHAYLGRASTAFLDFVRLLAVAELLQQDICCEFEAAAQAGFPSRSAYVRAFDRRETWRRALGTRAGRLRRLAG